MSQPLRIEVAGMMLQCKHCETEAFFRERVTLGRPLMGGLIHADGRAGRWSTAYTCASCGYMHFFVISEDYGGHELADTDLPNERIECLACGELVVPSESSCECQSCGWTWLSDETAADDSIDRTEH